MRSLVITPLCCLFLVSCSSGTNFAPVRNVWEQPQKHLKRHVVRKGETLYAIAWQYDLDYRTLAALNDLKPPYHLRQGQLLRYEVTKAMPVVHVKKDVANKKKSRTVVSKSTQKVSNQYASAHYRAVKHWQWPVKGKILKEFSPNSGSKGVDIEAAYDSPVRASAAGKVAYSGSGIRGYGKLLIIKHNNEFLSAYAYNSRLLVKEGQWVRAGQPIASVGKLSHKGPRLHFEIRKAGKPVNPLRYIR